MQVPGGRTAGPRRRTLPDWALDELASAGRENLDPAHVARYDAKEDAGAAAEVALLRRHGLDAGTRVVDLGAGTGQFTLAAARVAAHVTAVDVSPVMLAHLRERVAATGLDNVSVVAAGFLDYEHGSQPADLAYSRFALHHLPDFWKAVALTRIRALLRPGGLLRLWDVVYSFPLEETEERLEAWCATGGRDLATEWRRWEIEEHVRDEHSTFSWLLEPMVEQAGFELTAVEHSDDGLFARYLATAR